MAGERPHLRVLREPIPPAPATIEDARTMMFYATEQPLKYMTHPCFPEFMRNNPNGLEDRRVYLRDVGDRARYRLQRSEHEQDRQVDELAKQLMRDMKPLARECRRVLDPPLWRRIRRTRLDAHNLPEPIRSQRENCVRLAYQAVERLAPEQPRELQDYLPPRWPDSMKEPGIGNV